MTQTSSSATAVTLPSDCEIVFTRVFSAPRTLVFEAWTKPEHLAHWWGPRCFSLVSSELDLRPGGAWRFVMRGPDGVACASKGVYREVVPPERIVFTSGFEVEDTPNIEGLVTLTFAEHSGKTTLTMAMRYATPADRDALIKMQVVEGWSESFDRLAEDLAAPPVEIGLNS